MTMEKEDLKRFSTDLAKVMDDIGVNEVMVPLRRHLSFVLDRAFVISSDIKHCNSFTFGSQSEGSTTIGMHSDCDRLIYFDLDVACVHFADLQDSTQNYFVIKEPTCLPQCCCLMVVEKVKDSIYYLEKRNSINDTETLENKYVFDQYGRLLLNSVNAFLKFENAYWSYWSIPEQQHGPALTFLNNDVVFAIRCMTLPDNCRVLFTRPRPGHWPTHETLLKAEQCEVYMVNPGVIGNTYGYNSDYRYGFIKIQYQNKYVDSQFRISTNMIERLLMFDLSIVQMKAYVITKMILKEFLQPLVDERLSTFHMKTALLFTVELFPEDTWRNNNLVQCVINCLTTLKRFLKTRYCPHYTIGSVNLFAGKLKVNEFHILGYKVTEMINSGLICLQTLNMDHVGMRLSTNVADLHHHKILSRVEIHFQIMHKMITHSDYSHADKAFAEFKFIKRLASAFHSALTTEYEYRSEMEFMFQSICSIIASQEASECIANGSEVTSDIINMYETSLRSKAVTNHLRYASMLVCTHQFERAFGVLNKIEPSITHDAIEESLIFKQCINLNFRSDDGHNRCTPSETLMDFVGQCVFPLVFTIHEANCVPSHLIYEKFGTMRKDDIQSLRLHVNVPGRCIMHAFETSIRPFFYYLQYLSSSYAEKKQHALEKLLYYCGSELKNKTSDHLATELNMLGHVFELENDVSYAWIIYKLSVTIMPRYNAAYWHLFRLFGRVVYC